MASSSGHSGPSHSGGRSGNLKSVGDCICPVCLDILIQPVTMPCSHELCMPCFRQHVQETSLTCPVCRMRISNWARSAARDESLINKKRWEQIRKAYPKEVHRRMTGAEHSETDLYDQAIQPHLIIAEPGEVRKEYEEQLKRVIEERAMEQQCEEVESKRLIDQLQTEEVARLQVEEGDQAIAKRLQQAISTTGEENVGQLLEQIRYDVDSRTQAYSVYHDLSTRSSEAVTGASMTTARLRTEQLAAGSKKIDDDESKLKETAKADDGAKEFEFTPEEKEALRRERERAQHRSLSPSPERLVVCEGAVSSKPNISPGGVGGAGPAKSIIMSTDVRPSAGEMPPVLQSEVVQLSSEAPVLGVPNVTPTTEPFRPILAAPRTPTKMSSHNVILRPPVIRAGGVRQQRLLNTSSVPAVPGPPPGSAASAGTASDDNVGAIVKQILDHVIDQAVQDQKPKRGRPRKGDELGGAADIKRVRSPMRKKSEAAAFVPPSASLMLKPEEQIALAPAFSTVAEMVESIHSSAASHNAQLQQRHAPKPTVPIAPREAQQKKAHQQPQQAQQHIPKMVQVPISTQLPPQVVVPPQMIGILLPSHPGNIFLASPSLVPSVAAAMPASVSAAASTTITTSRIDPTPTSVPVKRGRKKSVQAQPPTAKQQSLFQVPSGQQIASFSGFAPMPPPPSVLTTSGAPPAGFRGPPLQQQKKKTQAVSSEKKPRVRKPKGQQAASRLALPEAVRSVLSELAEIDRPAPELATTLPISTSIAMEFPPVPTQQLAGAPAPPARKRKSAELKAPKPPKVPKPAKEQKPPNPKKARKLKAEVPQPTTVAVTVSLSATQQKTTEPLKASVAKVEQPKPEPPKPEPIFLDSRFANKRAAAVKLQLQWEDQKLAKQLQKEFSKSLSPKEKYAPVKFPTVSASKTQTPAKHEKPASKIAKTKQSIQKRKPVAAEKPSEKPVQEQVVVTPSVVEAEQQTSLEETKAKGATASKKKSPKTAPTKSRKKPPTLHEVLAGTQVEEFEEDQKQPQAKPVAYVSPFQERGKNKSLVEGQSSTAQRVQIADASSLQAPLVNQDQQQQISLNRHVRGSFRALAKVKGGKRPTTSTDQVEASAFSEGTSIQQQPIPQASVPQQPKAPKATKGKQTKKQPPTKKAPEPGMSPNEIIDLTPQQEAGGKTTPAVKDASTAKQQTKGGKRKLSVNTGTSTKVSVNQGEESQTELSSTSTPANVSSPEAPKTSARAPKTQKKGAGDVTGEPAPKRGRNKVAVAESDSTKDIHKDAVAEPKRSSRAKTVPAKLAADQQQITKTSPKQAVSSKKKTKVFKPDVQLIEQDHQLALKLQAQFSREAQKAAGSSSTSAAVSARSLRRTTRK